MNETTNSAARKAAEEPKMWGDEQHCPDCLTLGSWDFIHGSYQCKNCGRRHASDFLGHWNRAFQKGRQSCGDVLKLREALEEVVRTDTKALTELSALGVTPGPESSRLIALCKAALASAPTSPEPTRDYGPSSSKCSKCGVRYDADEVHACKTDAEETVKAPLSGEWRYSEPFICCGTLRIACADFDTDPSPEFHSRLMTWMLSRLNAESAPETPPVDTTLEQLAGECADGFIKYLDHAPDLRDMFYQTVLRVLQTAHARKSQPKETVDQRLLRACEKACIASCSCMTKTPDPDYHAESCLYKELRTAIIAAESPPPSMEVELAEALRPFAEHYQGRLESVGGGTMVSVPFEIQRYKDAKTVLDRYDESKK